MFERWRSLVHLPFTDVEPLDDSLDLPHLDVLIFNITSDFRSCFGIHFYGQKLEKFNYSHIFYQFIKNKSKKAYYSLDTSRKFDLSHLKALKAKNYVEKIIV